MIADVEALVCQHLRANLPAGVTVTDEYQPDMSPEQPMVWVRCLSGVGPSNGPADGAQDWSVAVSVSMLDRDESRALALQVRDLLVRPFGVTVPGVGAFTGEDDQLPSRTSATRFAGALLCQWDAIYTIST